MAERKAGERESERERSAAGRRPDERERERMQSSRAAAGAAPPPGTGAPIASSRSHYHHHPPSTARSSRYEGVSVSSSSMQRGPLTAERNMMETIRMKLERAQHRLAHQHAVQSATPGTSRYYAPDYESSRARTPAPAIRSVKLEDFSLQQQHYVPQPPPSSTTSGYMGVYPQQPPSTYRGGFADPRAAASQHHHRQQPQPSHHRDRSAAPATTTASTRPSRQSVPAPVHEPSARSTRPSASRHQQQYPAELQYKSASRNTATSDYQGTPLSSTAPFLAFSTSSRQPPPSTSQRPHHRQFASSSPMQAPAPSARAGDGAAEADRQHRHHRHDRTREPPPSAMRSAMQAPPSSRVRFEGHLDEYEEEERARAKFEEDRAREKEKAKLRQREKEQMHREFLLKERQKGSVSQDAAEQQLPAERQERTRRGSLPTPPKSEIDVNVWQHVKAPVPGSPSGRDRRGSSVVAAPPKSEIQVSGFDEAPVRRRSSAADQLPALSAEALAKDNSAKNSTKRDASSDEDDYTTPPTSPSSGASSSASGSSSGVSVSTKEKQIFEASESTKAPEEPPIPVNVKPVPAFRDYDDDFLLNQQVSPTKKPLSIWEEDDEEAIISSSNQMLTPKQQGTKAPLVWDEEKEKSEGDDKRAGPVSKSQESLSKKETPEETISKEETQSPEQESDNSENVPPLNQEVALKEEAASEISSNQVLSPVLKPAASPAPSSSAYLGSRSASPALEALRSRISAHNSQALKSPESAAQAKGPRLSPTPPPSRLSNQVTAAKATPVSPLSPATRSPPSPPLHPASEPRAAPTASMFPSRSSAAFQRPPSTTVGRPSVTRPGRVPPLPPAPHSMYMSTHQHSPHGLPPSTGSTGQRRLRHREPLDLKRQLPSQISALEGLTSGTNTFPLNEYAFYEIEWRTGEFGFSFQRVYSEAYEGEKSEMFLRMLLNTERGTCKSFRDVHVGDILIKIGDVKVSDLGFDTARDPGLALTKYFTELRNQTPMRLVFQRTEVLDWEGGVEL